MTEEEKKAIEDIKKKVKDTLPQYTETMVDGKPYRMAVLQLETRWTKETSDKVQILLNLIQKQDTEINKLNNVIEELVGEVEVLNYETIGKWCNKDKGDKCKNCDTNNHDCIKDYFVKEDK